MLLFVAEMLAIVELTGPGASTRMGIKIGLRDVATMLPNSIIWDDQVKGFCVRRQFSKIITFSVVYRTRDGQQKWFKLGRHPILTPTLALRRPLTAVKRQRRSLCPPAIYPALSEADRTLRYGIE